MIITKELAYQLKVLCDTATTDTSRPILTTVHVEVHAERCFLVATDGYRLGAVCLPIKTETEESFTLQIDATMLKKLLKAKAILSITPTSLDINGVSLPSLDIGRCYPDWRAIIPHNTEPRANVAAFMAKYSVEFLKFRLGRGYNKTEVYGNGLPTFSMMHYSIYDGDTCGMVSPHIWTWAESCGDDVIYYLHMLMPIKAMEAKSTYSFDDEDEREAREQAFAEGNKQLTELLQQRFTNKITDVTGPLVGEIWGRPEKKKESSNV